MQSKNAPKNVKCKPKERKENQSLRDTKLSPSFRPSFALWLDSRPGQMRRDGCLNKTECQL